MTATRYDAEARYELFAKLRAAHPDADFDEIMDRVYEIEYDAAQESHERWMDAKDAPEDQLA